MTEKFWNRSSYCEGGHCAEVHVGRNGPVLRASAVPDDYVSLTWDEWDAFVAGVKAGEFDRPEQHG